MEYDKIKDVAKKLGACKKPLIVMKKKPDADVLGASLGLFLALKKTGREPKLACSSIISKKYSYLAEYSSILNEISGSTEYCVTLDLRNEDIRSINAEKNYNSTKISIKAGYESILTDTLKLTRKDSEHDLIVTVSAPTHESMGSIYSENKDIFTRIDTININNSNKSENYGALNISDAGSTVSEIVFLVLSDMDATLVDHRISTALLSGIISGTKNFQREKIGYQTFEIASRLMANGADRDEVIRYFKRSNIPFYVIECYHDIASKIGRTQNITQALRSIEEFAKNKRLSAAEKAVLLIMVAVFLAQNVKIPKNQEDAQIVGASLINIPQRNIVYTVDKLPISDEMEALESLSATATVNSENRANSEESAPTSLIRVDVADPKSINIPSLKVNAKIQYVGLNDDGSAAVPSNDQDVAWYMFGPRPGETGNAVILGHRDSASNPNGVFRRLNDLKIDDLIEVTDINGHVLKFRVVKKSSYDDSDAPMKEIFGSGDKKMLNLITCSGAWDVKANNYAERIVIYSELTDQS